MYLVSWNINGIRAVHKKNKILPLFISENPDILAFQEIKAEFNQIPEEIKDIKGYFSYFAPSKVKKGYSGVAVYTKIKPDKVEYGIGIRKFDDEGRVLELHFKDFIFFNIYFPNGGGGPERLAYKLEFYDAFLSHIEKLKKKGKSIIFCGDVNTAHEEIDLARPKENEENTGFLPEERAWIDELIYHGYIDTFRHFNSHKKNTYTYWDMKTRARDRNVGWRIDYFFVSGDLTKKIKSAGILPEIYGSDHCPIYLEF
ncbi:MAG: exodeoxyribonuclease III [Patescibacteria group bacterium]